MSKILFNSMNFTSFPDSQLTPFGFIVTRTDGVTWNDGDQAVINKTKTQTRAQVLQADTSNPGYSYVFDAEAMGPPTHGATVTDADAPTDTSANVDICCQLVDYSREAAPGIRCAFYSFPPVGAGSSPSENYWRDPNNGTVALYHSEEDDTLLLSPLASRVQIFMPSLYRPDGYSMAQWRRLAWGAKEIIRRMYPFAANTPIVPLLSPVESGIVADGYINYDDWYGMLDFTYETFEGLMLWSPNLTAFDATKDYWLATIAFFNTKL